jgi:hypothetical protein
MTPLSLIFAALVMLLAIGVVLWAWWAMQRAEILLRISAGLEHADLDIGTWPPSTRISAPRATFG